MSFAKVKSNILSVTSYIGDSAVLLAFNLAEDKIDKLAGFAIKCLAPVKGPYPSNEYFLKNLLNLKTGVTSDKVLTSTNYVGSDQAPFQTFHWIHFPSAGPGMYRYTIYASYFRDDGTLELGPNVAVDVDLTYRSLPNFEMGFTRGYVSSQAYEDRFDNKDIRPQKKSIDFDTTPYQTQYQWLGGHARKLVFEFLDECTRDSSTAVDVFAYDFDEPDVIKALCSIGSRVRVFQDDSPLHTGPKAMEPETAGALENAGADVKKGHFTRFAHDKIMIQKKNSKAVKVLTGSANFSIRGLYVQANSILVFDDADIATLYEQAFQQAFTGQNRFKSSPVASRWYDLKKETLPPLSVSFAPHSTPFTLDKVSKAIESAKSSVFFAVMQMAGAGPVMLDLENLGDREDIFSLGTIESEGQLKLFKQGIDGSSAVTSFDFLHTNVPEPFRTEWRGGSGQVIHHKFVVCDFNDVSPVAFCGSSNLAAGGETSNGDNLIAIYDRDVATYYAVEAVRLFDHYRFRSLHEHSTSNNPLMLDSTDEWTKPYYDPKNIKFRERQILSRATSS